MRSGSNWSLAGRILALQAVLLVVILGAALAVLFVDTDTEAERSTGERVAAIATTVAASPVVRAAVTTDRPAGQQVSGPATELRRYAEDVRAGTGTDFVVIMSPDGIRYTHPDPSQIGKEYLGSRTAGLAGGTGIETYTGTLGPSVRAIVPVRSGGPDGKIVALVAVGVTVDHIGQLTQHRLLVVALVAIGALLLGLLGSLLIARWLRRQTLGMAPRELARLFTYYDAVLASVHEGMVLLDKEGRIVSVNVEGRRLLGLGDDAVGRTPAGAGLRAELAALLADSGDLTDELALTDDRVLLISRRPVRVRTELVGAVVTLRDHTELRSLTGELDRVQSFSDALRAQAHESANRLHTVISLIELGETDHALTFAVAELQSAQRLADRVLEGVGNPAVAALLLAKSAQAIERGIELTVAKGSYLPPDAAPDTELVTIVGNLVDNAFDVLSAQPAEAGPRRVEVAGHLDAGAGSEPDIVTITVTDNGPGLTPEQAIAVFARGWSTKSARGPAGDRGLGLALVAQAVARCGGTVTARPGAGARFAVRLPYRGDRESIGTVAVGAAGTATAGRGVR